MSKEQRANENHCGIELGKLNDVGGRKYTKAGFIF
jgi:hypothetical protein